MINLLQKIFSVSDEDERHTRIRLLGFKISLTKKKYLDFKKQKNYYYYKKNKIDIRTVPAVTGLQRDVQLAGLYLLTELDYVCKELSIEYWIDFGALLGAVRHKGFIPWDDDIDVGLIREDYNKLIANFDKIKRDSNIYLRFNVNIERKSSLLKLCHKGSEHLFVDIFPYDFYTKKLSDKEQFKLTKNHKKNRETFVKPIVCDIEKGKELHDAFSVLTTDFNNKNIQNPDIIWGHEFGHNWEKWIHSYDTIYPLQKIEFEGIEYPCINNYDKYLTDVYGKYMSYPPKIKLGHFVFIEFSKEELELIQELAKKVARE